MPSPRPIGVSIDRHPPADAATGDAGPARRAATINGFEPGNRLTTGDAPIVPSGVTGSVLNPHAIISATFGEPTFSSSAGELSADAGTVSCFAAGTRIATAAGLVAVESIGAGDQVCTVLGGDTATVIWTGYRKIDCARHRDPRKVWPVIISAHAFGRGMPASDLFLSPDHAVYVNRVLIPIRSLANGHTVRQVLMDRVSYHHIELARHDVLLANGMPAESYLDTGDRSRFSNGGGLIALHPDFAARAWEMNGCAPLVQTGPAVTAVRKRLAADVARRRRLRRDTFAPGTTRPR